ncbi:MAG TPA: nucleotide exchange factor GrpE [Solirubrobacteraceae bacterium]|nr:nucleotide exchange factor GrpE [Solirubrobacteraceae bacterium]
MVPNPKHAPEFAPGEPEAPVSAPQASPGPGASDGAPATPDNPVVPEPEPAPEDVQAGAEPLQAGPDQTPEDAIEDDLEQITAKAKKAQEYLELAQRTQADFENYRKRAMREAAAAQERGAAKLAKELLPAVDNLDRALEAAQHDTDNGHSTLVSGIKLVHADVIAALSRAGIERYEPKGEQFDPQRHEAVAQHPVEGAQPGTIVEVYQRGYALGDFVIRPARVVVAA